MKVRKQKNDCDVIMDGIENTFGNLGECFDSLLDEKQTKMSVVKNLFNFGGSLTKLAFDTTSCVVKNTPKAVVAVASAKREVVTVIEEEWNDYQKQQKEDALDEKIKQLKLKS